MKKLLIILIVFTSCGPIEQKNKIPTGERYHNEYGPTYTIVIIDSCEYLECPVHYGTILTHKGNCKFCQERFISKN